MKTTWFKKLGWFFIPTSIIGVVITLLAGVFCFTVFLAVDKNSHSVSDTLYGVFPYFVSVFAILYWVASHTSNKVA